MTKRTGEGKKEPTIKIGLSKTAEIHGWGSFDEHFVHVVEGDDKTQIYEGFKVNHKAHPTGAKPEWIEDNDNWNPKNLGIIIVCLKMFC